MAISKVKITNFKSIGETLTVDFSQGINILVGDNDVGKSTILEAIHLAFTGMFQGRPIKSNISEYVFNQKVVAKYLEDLKSGGKADALPEISIEVFFDGSVDVGKFEGDKNSDGIRKTEGFVFRIALDENLNDEYRQFCTAASAGGSVVGLPLEYYAIRWESFARNRELTPRGMPMKPVLINSANFRYHNGSDLYVHQLIRAALEKEDLRIAIQEHRRALMEFQESDAVQKINSNITGRLATEYKVTMSAAMEELYSVENSLSAHLDDVPFSFAGQGLQCVAKTDLALHSKSGEVASIILLEEPESHLSPGQLSRFMERVSSRHLDKQLIVSTHSSFVANKLGLGNLILMGRTTSNTTAVRLTSLKGSDFFMRLPGYDTLRIVLAKRVVLVEGASDELLFQRAYKDIKGKLPIDDGVDVVSVGIAFARFIPLIESVGCRAAIVTDNDSRSESLQKTYANYMPRPNGDNPRCCVFFEPEPLTHETFGVPEETIKNYATLEPYLLHCNSVEKLAKICGASCNDASSMLKYMIGHKVDCALAIFNSEETVEYPEYFKRALQHVM